MGEFNRKHPMKKYIHYSILAATILCLGTGQARAGDDEAWAAIGGFVAGVITGVAIDDDHHRHGKKHYRGEYRGRKHGDQVYYSKQGRHGYGHGPKGRWEYRRVKVWIPGHWKSTYGRHGQCVRIWKRGHHAWRKTQVWIPYGRHGSHRGNRG